MTGRRIFNLVYPIIIGISFLLKILPRKINIFLFQISSGIPTFIGTGIRYILLRALCKKIGRNVYIGRWCTIKNPQNIIIENNVSIHEYCYIDAIGGLIIRNNTSIAHNCSLLTFTHNYENNTIPIKYQKISTNSIVINENVWIGCGVRILMGIEINNCTIVGANSVVNKNIGPGIYAGVPTKKIKEL